MQLELLGEASAKIAQHLGAVLLVDGARRRFDDEQLRPCMSRAGLGRTSEDWLTAMNLVIELPSKRTSHRMSAEPAIAVLENNFMKSATVPFVVEPSPAQDLALTSLPPFGSSPSYSH